MQPSAAFPYPESPRDAPRELIATPPTYTRRAGLAMLGLLLFVSVYLGLTFYFGTLTYNLLAAGFSGRISAFFIALPPIFFLAFLLRGLFVIQRGKTDGLVEVTRDEQPLLFAFVDRLASETGASPPSKIFLSPDVNAAVTYDLSFVNLLFPSKKNLIIGVGLVNALTLDEVKAVIAHEMGHFAQRTMALGRWVYMAQQIVGHIVASRGAFDNTLMFISSIDLRVAWIGWIMRLFVWSIRAVLDTFFLLVTLADRALSREMEFQADRVAVSVSGSDSLIHALHKLADADDACGEAIGFCASECFKGRRPHDLFAVQTAVIAHQRRVLGEPELCATPRRPEGEPAAHRVFKHAFAQPPRMWSTHPANRDREDHAKAIYVPSVLDERSAFELFVNPERVREQMTVTVLGQIQPRIVPASAAGEAPSPNPSDGFVPLEVTLQHLAEERYGSSALDPRYHGVYLGRQIAAYHTGPEAMFSSHVSSERAEILRRLDAIYPESVRDDLKRLREQSDEELLLKGLKEGFLTAPGGVITHRGKSLRRRDLPDAIELAKADRTATEAVVVNHDRECRGANLDVARTYGPDWVAYLQSLAGLLHYTTHVARDIHDASDYLNHVLAIVLADGKLSSSEEKRLIAAASDAHYAVQGAFNDVSSVVLPPAVAARFEHWGGYEALKDSYGLWEPGSANLGPWLDEFNAWSRDVVGDLHTLSDAALDALLDAESMLARAFREERHPGPAPIVAQWPRAYRRRVIGDERERQKRLGWWDRFQTADGFVPGTLRLIVACAVLLPAMFVGCGVTPKTQIRLHNAFEAYVRVEIAGLRLEVPPRNSRVLEVSRTDRVDVVAHEVTTGALIERFSADVSDAGEDYVYNIANGAVLYEQTVIYSTAARGGRAGPDPRNLGAPRWITASQDYVFTDPPETMSSRRGESSERTVLFAVDDPDERVLAEVTDARVRGNMRANHLRLDAVETRALASWLEISLGEPSAAPVIHQRAAANPDDVVLQRASYYVSNDRERTALCKRQIARAEASPDSAGAAYMVALCAPEETKHAAFVEAYERFPRNGLIALGASRDFMRQEDWPRTIAALEAALEQVSWETEYITEELLRARRIAVASGLPVRRTTEFQQPESTARLEFFSQVDRTEQDPNAERIVIIYRALRDGDLQTVRRIGQGDVRVLLALSDGADPDLVQELLSRAPAEVPNRSKMWIGALAAREGRDPSPWMPTEGELSPHDLNQVRSVILELRNPTPDLAKIEAAARVENLELRGMIYATGVVGLGTRAPVAWRREVNALLFPGQRPYFAPAPPLESAASNQDVLSAR